MSVYAVVYVDESGDTILPDDENLPRVLYSSMKASEEAARRWMKTFDCHRFALYGEAYPYDETTLEQEVRTKGRGTVGWITMEDEDGDKLLYAIQIIVMKMA